MSTTLDKMEIDKKLHDAANGIDEHTIYLLFAVLHKRRETAKVILNDRGVASVRDLAEIMSSFKDDIVKLLNL